MNSLFQTLYKQLESWCFRILLEEYCLLGILLCKNHCKAKQRILLTKQTSSTRVRIAASSYNLRMGPSEQIHRVIRRDLLLFQVPPDPKWPLSIFFPSDRSGLTRTVFEKDFRRRCLTRESQPNSFSMNAGVFTLIAWDTYERVRRQKYSCNWSATTSDIL